MTGATRNGYYDAHIFCCINERKPGHKRGSCAQRGGETLRNYLKGRLKEAGLKGRMRANACGCLDRCELGPVMVVYPDAVWYSVQSRADVDEIIESHLKGGRPVTRLRLAHDQTELRPEQRAPADRAAPTPTDSDAESPA